MLGDLEKDHPHLKENLLSAMGRIETSRLLDTRYLDLEQTETEVETDPFVIVS